MDVKLKTLAAIIILFGALGVVSATGDPDTSCPFTSQDGRTIITFDEQILSNGNLAAAKTNEVSVSLTPGSYDVSLYAFDGPKTGRINHNQPDESYKLIFLNSSGDTVAESGATTDLADDNDTFAEVNELVSTDLDIPSGVVKVAGLHAVYPDNSNANSLIAGCAALDFNKEKEPEDDDGNRKSSKGSRNLLKFFCEPNWECSGWSECEGEVMTRNCQDTNSCENPYNKPTEITGCEMPKVLVEDRVNFLPILMVILTIILITILGVISIKK